MVFSSGRWGYVGIDDLKDAFNRGAILIDTYFIKDSN